MRVERLVLVLIALVAWPILPARAGGEKRLSVDEVEIVVRLPWPNMLSRGAQPFLFEVENRNPDARHIRLALTNGFGSRVDRLAKELEIDGRSRTTFELYAPVQTNNSSDYRLEARVGGEVDRLLGIGSAEQPNPTVRNVLVLVRDAVSSSRRGGWQDLLSNDARMRVTTEPTRAVPTFATTGFTVHSTSSGPLPDPVAVTPVIFADLPERYEAYTSIDGVVIDASAGLPEPEAMAALSAWTRLGGRLAILGPDARRVAESSSELAPWLEERFRVGDQGWVVTFVCGQGLLLVGESSELLHGEVEARALNRAMEIEADWIPKQGVVRGADAPIKLLGLELPYRSLTVILILFAVIIGPINFYFVRRTGRPALLLVTVPAIALVFSLGLFAFGAISQGLDVRASSATYALLDQRTHRSSAGEVRLFFAGLSAGAGLVPGPGASLWPEALEKSAREEKQYGLDFTRGTVLSGDFLPVRTPVRQTFLVDRPCRLRVEVQREGQGFVVQNGLGTTILSLAFLDADGHFHVLGHELPAGERGDLVASNDLPNELGQGVVIPLLPNGGSSRLPLGTYVARISEAVFSDRCGVDARETGSTHCVVGIVDMEEAR